MVLGDVALEVFFRDLDAGSLPASVLGHVEHRGELSVFHALADRASAEDALTTGLVQGVSAVLGCHRYNLPS